VVRCLAIISRPGDRVCTLQLPTWPRSASLPSISASLDEGASRADNLVYGFSLVIDIKAEIDIMYHTEMHILT
jgi:hypothetical protein